MVRRKRYHKERFTSLSVLNTEIEGTVFNDHKAFIKIPIHKMAMWVAKLYLGLLIKEYEIILKQFKR